MGYFSEKTLYRALLVLLMFFLTSTNLFGESLERAWDIAIQESRQLQASQHATAAANSYVSAAQSARLPNITNATAYTALSEQPTFNAHTPEIPLMPGVTIPSLGFQLPFMDKDFLVSSTMATVPLYTGGKISSLVEQAEAQARAAQSGEITSLQELKIAVAETYFLVLRIQGILEVLEDTQKAIAAHEKMAEDMYKTGLVTKNVLLAAQVARADIEQKVSQAKNTLDVAKAAYNRYLWRPLTANVELDLVQIPPLSGDLDLLTDAALATRSELKQLAAQSQTIYAKSKEERSARLPQVAAIGGYTYLQNESLVENDYWSLSVGMIWTPVDGGISRSKQQATEHQMTALNRILDETRSAISLQVRKNWLEEQESRSRVEVTRKAVERSEENLRVVNEQFKTGLVTHTEVLDAVAGYSQARTNYCNAAYDAILATYHLRRATGAL